MEYIGKMTASKIDFGGGSSTVIVPTTFVAEIKKDAVDCGHYCTVTPRGELFFVRQRTFQLGGNDVYRMPLCKQFTAYSSEDAAMLEAADR